MPRRRRQRRPKIPRSYKGVDVSVGNYMALDISDSPGGWDKKGIVINKGMLSKRAKQEAWDYVLEHEYLERKLALERGVEINEDLLGGMSDEVESIHHEVVKTLGEGKHKKCLETLGTTDIRTSRRRRQ